MAISSLYGLIGFPLGHSFSKKYFTEKFQSLGLSQSHAYEQFPIASIDEFPGLLAQHKSTLKGLNVTIPYKQLVMPFLSEIDSAAKKIGAVNTIKILSNGRTIGYNSDYWGFKNTLTSWTALAYFKSIRNYQSLEDKYALPWIRKFMGKNTTNLIWNPLFEGKFGKYKESIALTWFWSRIKKRSTTF